MQWFMQELIKQKFYSQNQKLRKKKKSKYFFINETKEETSRVYIVHR